MSEFKPSDDHVPGEWTEARLGDSLARDDELQSFLELIEERVNDDSSGTHRVGLIDLLSMVSGPLTFCATKAWNGIKIAASVLTDQAVRRAKAREIDSQAEINRAKATQIATEAEGDLLVKKQVVREKADSATLKHLKKLHDLGIDCYARLDSEGDLKIVFGRKKGS